MSQSVILDALGIDPNEFFISNTLLLYSNRDKSPFASVYIKDGKVGMKVGNDLPQAGFHVVLDR